MKKLITLLASASLSVIALSTIIACTDTPTTEIEKENEENETNPPETNKPVDLSTLNLQANLNFSSNVDINDQIIMNEIIRFNKSLELKWEYLTVINNEGFWLVSLNENIYINQIAINVMQKTNLNTFDPNIMLKTVEINKMSVLTAFKANNQELANVLLLCEEKDNQWIISVNKSNKFYDGEIVINIQLIKLITEVITQRRVQVEDANMHIKEVEWMIKEQYLELSNIYLIIKKLLQ